MTSRAVPYLSEQRIERDADDLLSEFERARGLIARPPVPIEDIVEKHLKLRLEIDDLHRQLHVERDPEDDPLILGAIYFDERRVVIDETLDPTLHRFVEGRFRFTLAHEAGGHWRLHRQLFESNSVHDTLFGSEVRPPIVCRSNGSRERIEFQADLYASCLLMPRKLIIPAWQAHFRRTDPLVVRKKGPFAEIPNWYEGVLNELSKPLAEKFEVSMTAMRIRLERLGLLVRGDQHQTSFNQW